MLRNDRFGWAGVVVWHVLLVMGFIFVAHITEKRPNPLRSRRGHYRVQLQPIARPICAASERSDLVRALPPVLQEVVKLLASGPLLFLLGPVFALAVRTSLLLAMVVSTC